MFVPDFELSSASALVSSSSVWLLLAAAIGLAIILAASGLDKSFFFFPSASSALCHRHVHKHICFVQNPLASNTSLWGNGNILFRKGWLGNKVHGLFSRPACPENNRGLDQCPQVSLWAKTDENSGMLLFTFFSKPAGPKISTCCGSLRFMGLLPLNSTSNSE